MNWNDKKQSQKPHKSSGDKNKKKFQNDKQGKPTKYLDSPNMHYCFYTEYFESNSFLSQDEKRYEGINRELENFDFDFEIFSLRHEVLSGLDGYKAFRLGIEYPGLLIGTGYPHDISVKNAIKGGFSFDYVTGLPYLPGSSVKGMLRSYFPKSSQKDGLRIAYFQELLPELTEDELVELEEAIFDNADVFLDAYPKSNCGPKLLKLEFITPHQSIIEDPKPLTFLKVRPKVHFEFSFILKDSVLPTGTVVTAEEKKSLFKQLILDFGMGAKTNVGFGQFVEVR